MKEEAVISELEKYEEYVKLGRWIIGIGLHTRISEQPRISSNAPLKVKKKLIAYSDQIPVRLSILTKLTSLT